MLDFFQKIFGLPSGGLSSGPLETGSINSTVWSLSICLLLGVVWWERSYFGRNGICLKMGAYLFGSFECNNF
jgi:hypothetical protein